MPAQQYLYYNQRAWSDGKFYFQDNEGKACSRTQNLFISHITFSCSVTFW